MQSRLPLGPGKFHVVVLVLCNNLPLNNIVKIKGTYLSSVNKLLGIHSDFFHKISEQPDRIVN